MPQPIPSNIPNVRERPPPTARDKCRKTKNWIVSIACKPCWHNSLQTSTGLRGLAPLPVLVEKPGRNTGQVIGRSPYLQSVHFDYPAGREGEIVACRIDGTKTNSLSGIAVEAAA